MSFVFEIHLDVLIPFTKNIASAVNFTENFYIMRLTKNNFI